MLALEIIGTIFGILGALFNAQMLVSGFLFWIIANVCLFFVALSGGHYWMASLFVYYTWIAVQGIRTWERKRRNAWKMGGNY